MLAAYKFLMEPESKVYLSISRSSTVRLTIEWGQLWTSIVTLKTLVRFKTYFGDKTANWLGKLNS